MNKLTLFLILVLASLFLFGCAGDDVGRTTNFIPAYEGVAVAKAATVQAASTAALIAKQGAKPGDSNTQALTAQVKNISDALDNTTDALNTAKAENQKQADADASAVLNANSKHWHAFYYGLGWIVATVVLVILAPVIVSATGTAAAVNAIPIVGGIAGTAERTAAGILCGILFAAGWYLGSFLGIF